MRIKFSKSAEVSLIAFFIGLMTAGAGSVQIRAVDRVAIQGTFTANGGNGGANVAPGASGGGGGRIAVWRIYDNSTSVISNYVNGGAGYYLTSAGTPLATGGPGTIVYGWTVPPKGTIVTIC